MLRFAEAKNGALLAAAMGGIALFFQIILKYFNQDVGIPIWLAIYSVLGLSFLATTVCLCLHSFIPKYKSDHLKDDMTSGSRNLTYYDDIRRFSLSSYKTAMLSASTWSTDFSKLEDEYITQSIIISRITCRKMEIFKLGIYTFLLAAFTPFGGIVFILYNRYSDHLFRKMGQH